MGDWHSHIPQYGGIRQVSLHSGNRELGAQMLEYCVCHSEVALGVLEVDRVNLVRHR